jgi:hypothetical protein
MIPHMDAKQAFEGRAQGPSAPSGGRFAYLRTKAAKGASFPPGAPCRLKGANPMPGSRPILTLPPRTTLTAKRRKVTLVLDANGLLAVPAADGKARATLRIGLPDRKLTADIAAKSLRKAQAAIREAGAAAVTLILQGCLVERDMIAEAGLSAQHKAAKPAQAQDENVGAE